MQALLHSGRNRYVGSTSLDKFYYYYTDLLFQSNNENGKLKKELDKLAKQLEDERQKVEDLMFRNEEENINKEDYNVSNSG